MNIMIYDVAAESGGAVTILNYYYDKCSNENDGNTYYFILSVVNLENTLNINVLNFPWIKKSWIHRLYFDIFYSKRIIKRYSIDKIISLQNTIIPYADIEQTVYEHNVIPFSEYHFHLYKEPLLWVYQNIIGFIIKFSLKKADKVIVQTNWMKDDIVKSTGISSQKILVEFPNINIVVGDKYKSINKTNTFFYPASGVSFKNHKVIIDACMLLNKKNIKNYNIVLTLNGNETKNIKELYEITQNNELPVNFVGVLSTEEVYSYYSNSILVFPSYIETIGLPLIEAKMHETPILASDCKYSHEILDDYDNVKFFNPENADELMKIMYDVLN